MQLVALLEFVEDTDEMPRFPRRSRLLLPRSALLHEEDEKAPLYLNRWISDHNITVEVRGTPKHTVASRRAGGDPLP